MGLGDIVSGVGKGLATSLGGIYGAAASGLFGSGDGAGSSLGQYNPIDINAPYAQGVKNYQKGIADLIGGLQAPDKIEGYTAKDYSKENLPEFTDQRNILTQQLNAQEQGQRSAMERKFAALGGLNSGSAIRNSQIANQAAAENRGNALTGLSAKEAEAKRGLQQQENQKEFQSGENAKTLNAQMANQFQQFKTGLGADSLSKIAQLDMGYKGLQQQSADEAFNAAMAQYQARHSGGLLGAGGIFGLGIGV